MKELSVVQMEEIEGGNLLACLAYGFMIGFALTNPAGMGLLLIGGPSAAYLCSGSFG